MTKIFTTAHVPDELRQAWLQHLRDFDTAHPGCHFEVAVDAPEASLAEMVAELRLNPELTFQQIFERESFDYDEARVRAALTFLLRPETTTKARVALARIIGALNREALPHVFDGPGLGLEEKP